MDIDCDPQNSHASQKPPSTLLPLGLDKVTMLVLLLILCFGSALSFAVPPPPPAITGPSSNTTGQFQIRFPPYTPNGSLRRPDEFVISSKISAYRNGTLVTNYNLASNDTARDITVSDAGTWEFRHIERRQVCYQRSNLGCIEPDFRFVTRATHTVSVTSPAIGVPGGFSVPATDNNGQFEASWNASSGPVTRYEFRERTLVNGSWSGWTVRQNNSALKFQFSNSLSTTKPDGTYQYYVRGCNALRCSGNSPVKTIDVAYTPGLPASASVSASEPLVNGDPTVSWGTASGNVDIYHLYRQKNGAWDANPIRSSATPINHVDANLTDGQYKYRVKACNSTRSYTQCSGFRESRSFTVLRKPSVPGGLSATGSLVSGVYRSTNGVFDITWNAAGGTVNRYELEQSTNNTNWQAVALDTLLSRIKNFPDTDDPNTANRSPKPDGDFYYRIKACNAGSCSNPSGSIRIRVRHIPGVPGNFAVPASSNNGQYTSTWTKPAGAVSYYQIQENGSTLSPNIAASATSFNHAVSTTNTNTYRIRACNEFNACSNWSPTDSIDVAFTPNLPSSINVSPAISNHRQFAISWGTSTNGSPTSYRLQRQLNDGSWAQVFENAPTNTDLEFSTSPRSTTDNVGAEGNYKYRVQGCRKQGSYTSCSGYRVLGTAVKAAAPPSFAVANPATVTEGPNNVVVRFAVTKTGLIGENYTVQYTTVEGTAKEGSDYVKKSGTLTFTSGSGTQTQYVDVPVVDNNALELQESFILRLSNASGNAVISNVEATARINDNDSSPTFKVFSSLENEGAQNGLEVVIQCNGETEIPLRVNYATHLAADDTADGADFTSRSGAVVFGENGNTSNVRSFFVPINNDAVYEGDETFSVTISDYPSDEVVIDISTATAKATIQDNDNPPRFSIDAVIGTADEGQSLRFKITKTGLSKFSHRINYATVAGSAKSPSDFVALNTSRNFAADTNAADGITQTYTFDVTTTVDTAFELDENFSLTLSAPTNSASITPGKATVGATIKNDDEAPHFSINDVSVNEETGGATFKITKTGNTALSHTIAYATANGSALAGSDYVSKQQSVIFAPNETEKNVAITIQNDVVYEGNTPENFAVNLSSSDANLIFDDSQGVATIADNDTPPRFSVSDASVEEGGFLSFIISKQGLTQLNHRVTYSTADGTASANDYANTFGSHTFSANESSYTVTVATTDDSFGEWSETVLLTLNSVSNGASIDDNSGVGTITDNDNMPPATPPSPLAKPIPPASAVSDSIAAVPGQFRVDENGAATYTIPITTPVGTAGVVPQVALHYSSQGGNGLLGQGWNIAGLSAISRCRQTLNQDGNAETISWSEKDRFCLDGQRLLASPGQTYGAVGTSYVVEVDAFTRIQSHGGSTGYPAYFTVVGKDGSIRYFGNNTNSRQRTSDNQYTLSWALNRMEDSVGNGVDYRYFNDADGQRIQSIGYAFGNGGSANTQINFNYQNRPDGSRAYVSGYPFNNLKRLAGVEVINNGESIRNYQFSYEPLPFEYRRNTSYLKTVTECVGSVCREPTTFSYTPATTGFSGTRRQAIELPLQSDQALVDFTYGDINGDGCLDMAISKRDFDNDGDHDDRVSYYMSDCQRLTQTAFSNGQFEFHVGYEGVKVKLLDYNGDGLADFFYYHPRFGWRIHLAIPTAERSGKLNANFIDLGFPENTAFGDFNSDGLVDVITGDDDGTLQLRILEPDPTQSVSSNRFYHFGAPITLTGADFTYQDDSTGITVTRSFDSITAIGDLNGDGIFDIAVESHANLRSPGCVRACSDTNTDPKLQYFLVLDNDELELFLEREGERGEDEQEADINGDGYVDFIVGNTVRLNRGDGTLANEITVNLANNKISLIDYNGDGYTDFINKNGEVALWNAGNGNFDPSFPIVFPALDGNDDAIYADINGDGKQDLVTLLDRRDFGTQLGLAFEIPSPQISQIDNGLGKVTEIDYNLLRESNYYSGNFTPASNSQSAINEFYARINSGWDLPAGSQTLGKISPVMNLLGPLSVVVRVSETAPTAGATPANVNANARSYVSYRYRESKVQAGGRGLLGFQAITSIDEQTGVETTTTYRQDWPFLGYPLETTARTSAGHLLSKATNTWQLKFWTNVQSNIGAIPQDGTRVLGALKPFLYRSVEQSYDLVNDGASPGALLSTVTTTNQYDGSGNPLQITMRTEGAGQWYEKVTVNEYGPGEVLSLANSPGLFSFADLGRVTRTTITASRSDDVDNVPQTRTSAFTYYTTGALSGLLKTDVVEPDFPEFRRTTTYVYDNFGNKTQITQSGQGVADRLVITTYDPSGRYVEQTKNAFGQATKTVHSRNALGLALDVSDINGVHTYFDYSAFGDEVQQYTQTGAWTQTLRHSCADGSCPSSGEFYQQTVQASGARAINVSDALGRVIRESTLHFDGSWTHMDMAYDSLGRVKHKSEPFSPSDGSSVYWTKTHYDIMGRVVRSDLPGISQPMLMSYSGFSTTTTNPEGQIKTEQKNPLEELVRVTDNLGAKVVYLYDAQGNLRIVQQLSNGDAVSAPIYMCYDLVGRKTATRDPDKGGHLGGVVQCPPAGTNSPQTGWWLYQHNIFGEVTQQIDAKGQRSTMSYDVLGRTTDRIDYRSNGTTEGNTTWSYNNANNGRGRGEVFAVSDSLSGYSKLIEYDLFGRVETVITNLGGEGDDNHFEHNTYDQIGRAFQIFDAAGDGSFSYSGIQHSYNQYGFLAEVINANQIDGAPELYYGILAMDRRGNVIESLGGNGLVTSRYYELSTGRLRDITTTAPGAGQVQDLHYDWDDLGNLTRRTDQGAGKNLEETFDYDQLNRLTYAGVTGGAVQTVSYDSLGNITSKSDVGTYSYLSQCSNGGYGIHAVCQTSDGIEYQYDANGNMIADSSAGGNGGRTISYTSFDKPERITRGGHTTTFKYAPDRMRFLRTDTNSEGTKVTRYIGNVEKITHVDGSQSIKRFLPGGVLITIEIDAVGNTLNNDALYRYFDHLGSLDVITDTVGNLLEVHSFDPWGQRRNPLDWQALPLTSLVNFDTTLTNRGFTGHEMLDEVGLIHMNGRIYDPRLGRFVQADSFIDGGDYTQGYNRYSYVYNNPLNATDPTGHFLFTLAAIALTTGEVITGFWAVVGTFAAAGFADALVQGASFSQALRAGVFAGISTAAFTAIGGLGKDFSFLGLARAESVFLVRGITGGVLSELQGGKFGHGFASAAIPTAVGQRFGQVSEIIASGTVSEATGGKFKHGALQSTYNFAAQGVGDYIGSNGTLYEVHYKGDGKYDRRVVPPGEDVAIERLFENGILNTPDQAFVNAHKQLGTDSFYVFHNPTRGIVSDLIEATLGTTLGASNIAKQLSSVLSQNSASLVLVVGHSQGAIIVANALNRIPGSLTHDTRIGFNGPGASESRTRNAVTNAGAKFGTWNANPLDSVANVVGLGAKNPLHFMMNVIAAPLLFTPLSSHSKYGVP